MGATSGLGLSLAKKFMDAGWLVGAAGRKVTALEELRKYSSKCVAVKVIDITKKDSEKKLLELFSEMGGIDLYLHCSGVLPDESTLNLDNELLIVDTNVGGFTRMIATAYNYFKSEHEKNPGKKFKIAAITSIAGFRGIGELPGYTASKAFDSTYLEALRQRADKEKLPLKVIDIRPGWTRTPLLSSKRKYLFETDAEPVVKRSFRAILKSKRGETILARWKFFTFLEQLVPPAIWTKLHLPLWEDEK